MKMNLLTELICNVLLYSIGFGGLMVVCAVAEGQLSLLPALAIGAVPVSYTHLTLPTTSRV